MTPIRLSIEGLYSYRSRQTIDFENLCRARLFGIFGNVGSGKSSVLEAISYALYGETERLSKQDNRGYNMMNLQSDELHIDFEFSHPTPDQRYRFTVSNKRQKKDRSITGTPKRIAYKWDGLGYIAIESADAEQILGINYDNFKRTVIIPQGRFMEFLQLKPAERTAMLKELFGLHQFELYNQTASLEKSNTEELNKLTGTMAALGQIDTQDIAAAQEQIISLRLQSAQKETELRTAENLLAQLAAVKETAEKISALRLQIDQQMSQKDTMDARRSSLAEYERCASSLAPLMDAKTKTDRKMLDLTRLVEQRKVDLDKLQTDYSLRTDELAALQTQLLHNEADASKAADLETVISIQRYGRARAEAQARITNGNELIAGVKHSADTRSAELQSQQAVIDSSSHIRRQMQVLQSNKSVMLQYAMAEEKVQNIKNQIIELEKQINDLKTENTHLLLSQGIPDGAADEIQLRITDAKQQIAELQIAKQQLAITENLSRLAGDLHDGDECPVCGATEHPHKLSPAEISEDMKTTEAAIALHDAKVVALQKAETSIQKNTALSEQLHAKRNILDKQIHTETIARNTILGQIDGPVLPIATIDKQIAELQVGETALQKAEEAARALSKEIAGLKEKEIKYTQGIQNIQNEFTAADTQVKSLTSSIRSIQLDAYLPLHEQQLQDTRSELLRAIDRRTKAAEEAQKQIISLTAELSLLQGQLASNTDEHAALRTELAQINTELGIQLAQLGYADLAPVAQILAQKINIVQERALLDTYFMSLMLSQQQLEILAQQAGGQSFDPAQYAAAQETSAALKGADRQLRDAIAARASQLEEMQSRYQRLLAARTEWDARSLRAENIRTMMGLFKGSGFVNYVSTVYLQNLCTMANKRFRSLTNQKLQLELSEDNNFLVRDFLNNGETRSVKTLSGGQSFQAALSLALALSDSIQLHSGYTQNFFFLDEGFGSQDADSLHMIFETFESLRAEDKTVGIISHVNALKEEISAYIQIENTEQSGSQIRHI